MKIDLRIVQPTGFLALVLLALTLPFEMEAPWFTAGPLLVTNTELLLLVTLLFAAAAWLFDDRARLRAAAVPRSWLLLGALFGGALVVTALLAPALRGNALKAVLRTGSGMLLVGTVPLLIRSQRQLFWLAGALSAGALVAALLGWYEVAAATVQDGLSVFRPAPSVTGAFIRLSGPFDYANQAAMFFEAVVPLLVAAAWWFAVRRRWGWFSVTAAGSLILVQAIMLTLSRAGFATVLLTSAAAAMFLFAQRGQRRSGFIWGAAAVATGTIFLLNSLLNPAFRLRLQSEGDDAWYRVRYRMPAEIEMTANQETRIRVSITNESIVTWRNSGPNDVRLMARWIDVDRNLEIGMPRWNLPGPLRPGETATWEIVARAPPEPGQYRMVWDLEHHLITWFSTKNGIETTTRVSVQPDNTGRGVEERATAIFSDGAAPWQIPAPIPPRRTLWQAALEMFLDRPVLGIGLDNFRLTYGSVLGLVDANTTIHTNNWILELLVSTGLLGTVPFLFWLAWFGWEMLRRAAQPGFTVWHMAIGIGIAAYVVHGVLDYFMLFNATALLFWILVGMWRWQVFAHTGQ